MTRVTIEAREVSAWRGARGSMDMMVGKGALVLTAVNDTHPNTIVEFTGTPEELARFKDLVVAALESERW